MKNKKELVKIILVMIIVIIAIFYYFFANTEEYDEIEIVENQSFLTNNLFNSTNENNIEKVKIKVYIIGEVKNPGVIELDEGSRLEDVIILAGGTTNSSDLSKVNLAYVVEDGEKIYIPSIYENTQENDVSSNNDDYIIDSNKKDEKININTADLNELCELPGVGEAVANKIITYRKENGKFKNIEDLKNVNGIGDKKYESLKEYICVK